MSKYSVGHMIGYATVAQLTESEIGTLIKLVGIYEFRERTFLFLFFLGEGIFSFWHSSQLTHSESENV